MARFDYNKERFENVKVWVSNVYSMMHVLIEIQYQRESISMRLVVMMTVEQNLKSSDRCVG